MTRPHRPHGARAVGAPQVLARRALLVAPLVAMWPGGVRAAGPASGSGTASVPAPLSPAADALMQAIAVDDDRAVTRLLAAGTDPNLRDARGQVALYVAVRDRSPRCARVLVEAPRLEVDAVNAAGETPLMMAALRGDEAIARRLLARGAAAHREGWSPLHYAASGGSTVMVRLFLSLGAPVDARAPQGLTPLMLAARYGGSEVAQVLLEAGADRALRSERGRDAAQEADAAGNDAVAAWLRDWHPPRAPRPLPGAH